MNTATLKALQNWLHGRGYTIRTSRRTTNS